MSDKKKTPSTEDVMAALKGESKPTEKKVDEAKYTPPENASDLMQRTGQYKVIDIKDIIPSKDNREVDADRVQEMVRSIGTLGQLVPVTVDEKMVLIDGEHRYRAMVALGVKKIKAIITGQDRGPTYHATNYLRENPTMHHLQSIFKAEMAKEGATQKKLADQFGVTQGYVSQVLNLGQKKDKATGKNLRWIKVKPAEGVTMRITDLNVAVEFQLTNADLKGPIAAVTAMFKEIKWKSIIDTAREALKGKK